MRLFFVVLMGENSTNSLVSLIAKTYRMNYKQEHSRVKAYIILTVRKTVVSDNAEHCSKFERLTG